MAGSIALACANQGAAVAWMAPTFKNSCPLWRFAERITAPNTDRLKIHKAEREIEFPSGGVVSIWSADAHEAMLGNAFDLVIVDEAARVKEEAWTNTIQATLADRAGRAMLISTPKGQNWFWREFMRAQADGKDSAAFTAPTNANPNPNIRRAFELARDRVPERTYRQEWLAEFIADGTYFRNVNACAVIDAPDQPARHEGHSIVVGVDWGNQDDFTVITTFCRECARVVDWDRSNQIGYISQYARIRTMTDRWHPAGLLPERNSIGEPSIEQLRAAGMPILLGPDGQYGFNTLPTTKPELIQSLALTVERHEIEVPRDYAGELMAYEEERTATGKSTWSAPSGQHDDRVMSLALAYWAASHSTAQVWI